MKVSSTVYVHAHFTREGKFSAWQCSDWKIDAKPTEHGFFVLMHTERLEFDAPVTENDARVKAAQVLGEEIEKKKNEHRDWIRDAMALHNRLLALPMADIIDAVPREPKRPDHDDDFPF